MINIQEYYNNLLEYNEALEYLLSRKIRIQSIHKFKIGYCYDGYFRNRITIPLFHNNECVQVTGRAFPDGKIKYKHLDKPIEYAFNHDVIANNKNIFVTEGPFDAIMLDQYGFPAISLLGLRINQNVLSAIQDKHVYLVFDCDPNQAGQNAARRIANKLYNNGIHAHIVELGSENGKEDVNSFLMKYDIGQFIDKVNAAKEFVGVKEPTFKRNGNGSIEKVLEKYYPSTRIYGGKYKLKCMFHEEKTPSLVIYPKTNSGYCFGCGRYVNPIDLIIAAEKENGNYLQYDEAEKLLKDFR